MKIDYTLVVSGIARSGSSMTMRVLDFGGVPITASNEGHEPSQRNVYGHYEFPRISEDLSLYEGAAIKVLGLHQRNNTYREIKVIVPVRSAEQIACSMLLDSNIALFDTVVARVKKHYEELFAYLQDGNIPTLKLNYDDYFLNIKKVCSEISVFVGEGFDKENAELAVDKTLYKIRDAPCKNS